MQSQKLTTLEMTNAVIVAFLSKNAADPTIVTDLMRSVHGTLVELERREATRATLPTVSPQKPAVPLDQSFGSDFVFCIECGRKFKSLRYHLARHGLTGQEYLAKWALPAGYPLVAPSLSTKRSQMAVNVRFGSTWRENAAKRLGAPAVAKTRSRAHRP